MPRSENPRAPNSVLYAGSENRRLFAQSVARSPALASLCDQGGRLLRTLRSLLEDAFCVFHDPGAKLIDEPGGVDKLQYLIVRFLLQSEEYLAIRSRTAHRADAALCAAEEFGRKLLDYLEASAQGQKSEGARASDGPPVSIKGVVFRDSAGVGAGVLGEEALLVLAKQVSGAIEELQSLADACNTWGIAPGSLRELTYEQRASLARQFAQTARLKRLADLVGRYRQLAQARRAKRLPGVPGYVDDVVFGDDWARFLPRELANLTHSALRYDFYRRVIDRQVEQYEFAGEEGRGKGPVIVCIDTSGSMCGERELRAKATALALLDITRREKRPFAAVLFSSAPEWLSLQFDPEAVHSRSAQGETEKMPLLAGICRVGSLFYGGGTDYESPLTEAARLIAAGHERWRHADIVFITDDYCDVSPEFLGEFLAQKRAADFSVFGVIVGAAATDARILWKFSDRVVSASEFDEGVAERVFDAL